MPHAAGATTSPPSDVTQSTNRSASRRRCRRSPARAPPRGSERPVEVSAWTTPTSFVSGCFASASATCSSGTIWPSGAVSSTRSAPARRAISAMRAPKNPAWSTSTVSPGSTRFAIPASMPEVPLALKQSERPSERRQSALSPSARSSSRSQKSGSRCPLIGSCMASRTLGCTFDGPGPHRRRSPGSIGGMRVTRSAMLRLLLGV